MKKHHELLSWITLETVLELYSHNIATVCYDGKYCTVEREK